MATTKASAKKSSSSRTTAAAKKTTVKKKTVESKEAAAAKVTKPAPVTEVKILKKASRFPVNLPNIILAELLGTFILTIIFSGAFAVAPYAAAQSKVLGQWLVDPLFLGLTLTVLTLGMGVVSGTHLNPAVTFGFWTMRKLKSIMLPVYWGAQFLGALLAVGVISVMTNGQSITLANFWQFNVPLFFMELIGTAILMFGITSITRRVDLSIGAKAVGIGMSFAVALVAGVSMLAPVQNADIAKYKEQAQTAKSQEDVNKIKIGRPVLVNTAVLNPAAALAVRENGNDQQTSSQDNSATTKPTASRFGLEVILGSLIGAAIGGNLYMLVAYRAKDEVVF